jgi:uncharacterized membrane protein YkvA (DUF1232 family)
MTNKKDQQIEIDRKKEGNEGFFGGIYDNLRLIVRLIKDPRVNILLKILPIGTLIYLVVPFDFLPINPIDDGFVIFLGSYLFIELCPEDVVEEHRKDLRQPVSVDVSVKNSEADVVEGEYKDVPTGKIEE